MRYSSSVWGEKVVEKEEEKEEKEKASIDMKYGGQS